MKWEEAIKMLNEIIPQEAGYFILRTEQWWHDDSPMKRRSGPGLPEVKLVIEHGPNGGWQAFAAANIEALVAKARWAYENRPVVVPDTIEAEAAEIVEPSCPCTAGDRRCRHVIETSRLSHRQY